MAAPQWLVDQGADPLGEMRILKRLGYDWIAAYRNEAALQMALKMEVRRLQAVYPEDVVYWVMYEDPRQVQIHARPRHVAPSVKDPAPEIAEAAVRKPGSWKPWLMAVLLVVGIALYATKTPREELPPGVLHVERSPNGCVYETKRIEGVRWVIPQPNTAFYDGLCAGARIVQ